MNTTLFLALLPSHDNRRIMTEKILSCETKRSPLARIQWSHTNDLHIILGAINNVRENDFRNVALALNMVSQSSPLMANVEEIGGFGNAIVLKIGPHQQLLNIHKKMNQKLIQTTQNLYQFDTRNRFLPQLVVGRVHNLQVLNQQHKQQLLGLVEEQFRGYSFLIQQAALVRKLPEKSYPAYQSVQLYTLAGSK
ncbi:MAG: hypothetical protein JSS07_06065 [Proteobacteria bacterium]|nr:hypothetical protein [Pseudomonadota bacterium]